MGSCSDRKDSYQLLMQSGENSRLVFALWSMQGAPTHIHGHLASEFHLILFHHSNIWLDPFQMETIQNPPRHKPVLRALGDPDLAGELGFMVSRGASQP